MLSWLKYAKMFKLAVCLFGAATGLLLLFNFVLAAAPDTGLDFAAGTGLSNAKDIRIIIAEIIRIIIGFLGIIAVGLIIYAGWLWMTSEGNEEKVAQAKKILINAVIGLAIIFSAFAIASFVLNALNNKYGSGGGTFNPSGGGVVGGLSALGSGALSSHYPERNQKNVPRNTKIIVSFKEPVDPQTISGGGLINPLNIRIYKTKDGPSVPLDFDVSAVKNDDNKTFVFKPKQYLGSPAEKIYYSVALGKNIKKANGDYVFAGFTGDWAYDWMFEVGFYIDVTPPKIEGVIPRPDATEPKNVIVQINFNEAIDPVSASGATASGFNNVTIKDGADPVGGNYYSANQYRTIEFLTEDKCGVNSCGNDIYCLPGGKSLVVLLRAASLDGAIYDGVMDLASNSLDGNGDGAATGPQAQSGLEPFNANDAAHDNQGDDFTWSFKTSDKIDATAPVIKRIKPDIQADAVDLSAPLEAEFNKIIMAGSLNSSSAVLSGGGNYWLKKANGPDSTTAYLFHDQFAEKTAYQAEFNSGIKDIYQNCFSPCSGLGVSGAPSCCNGAANSAADCQ